MFFSYLLLVGSFSLGPPSHTAWDYFVVTVFFSLPLAFVCWVWRRTRPLDFSNDASDCAKKVQEPRQSIIDPEKT